MDKAAGVLKLPVGTGDGRLSDAVYEALLDGILGGKLPPGTVVSEVSLSKQLEVSRTPVHDALRQLSKDGLVQQRANHRAVVATFSREDLRDIFDMRILLESEAAKRAATRIDRGTLAELRTAAEALAAEPDADDFLRKWADFDDDFHEAVARNSGSKRLWQDIARYRMLHRAINRLVGGPLALRQAVVEHLAILKALEQRDGEEASRAMGAHIHEWQTYFVNRMPA